MDSLPKDVYEQMQRIEEVLLSDLGININEKDKKVNGQNLRILRSISIQGKTLLHYVGCLEPVHGKTSSIDCLVDAGADLSVQDSDGRTPLMSSLLEGSVLEKNIKCLIHHYAGTPALNAEDMGGNNLLHLAASIKETKFTNENHV